MNTPPTPATNTITMMMVSLSDSLTVVMIDIEKVQVVNIKTIKGKKRYNQYEGERVCKNIYKHATEEIKDSKNI